MTGKTITGSFLMWALVASHCALISWAGDFRDLYGILWRGTPADNLKFAKQMAFDNVGYQPGMENDPNAAGMKFFIQAPGEDQSISPVFMGIWRNNTYTAAEIDTYNSYFAWKSNDPFPNNLAPGWTADLTGNYFSINPDWQQQKVIDWFVNAAIAKAKGVENPSNGFTFGGFMWDVPDLTGGFYSGPVPLGQPVLISYWTGSDSCLLHPGITHEYATYTEGRAAMIKQLLAAMRLQFPDAKVYMDPYYIYDNWIAQIQGRPDAAQLMPDLLGQEAPGTLFVDDNRIFASGLVTKDRVATSDPYMFSEYDNRNIAGKAAINGAWFIWFGEFGGGGTGIGDMPNYQNVYELPARLQLIRRLPNWDNRNGVPLSARSWDGTVYSSPNSRADGNVIYSRNPKTGKIFTVFLNGSGSVALGTGETVTSVQRVDGYFIESGDGSADVSISGGQVNLTNLAMTGNGYIITTNKGSEPPLPANTLAPAQPQGVRVL